MEPAHLLLACAVRETREIFVARTPAWPLGQEAQLYFIYNKWCVAVVAFRRRCASVALRMESPSRENRH